MSGYNANAPRGYQTKSAAVSNTAKGIDHADFGFTADELAAASQAVVTAHTAAVVFAYSGETPTATHGHVLPANGTVTIEGHANVQALELIRQSSDATVSITLEG